MNIFRQSKIKFFLVFIIFLISTIAKSDVVKKIEVDGNVRLANDTIILFSEIDINKKVDNVILNKALKNLYDTNYFENVKINYSNKIVKITVIESPIIEFINVKGIKSKKLTQSIEKITKKKEKYPYKLQDIHNQKNQIINLLKNHGYYFLDINVDLKENKNNTVEITYNFDLGERAEISKIKFIGNKVFKSSKLRNVIVSEEAKFWKFVTRNKYLDENRIQLDTNLLLNFYRNKGYYKVQVKPSSAKILNEENFELTFNIDANEKYYFNNFNLINIEDYGKESFVAFNNLFEKLKGKKYSLNSIKKILKEIDRVALQKEFVFINAKYKEKIIDDNKIDIDIVLEESEKFYIERIDIFGNFITEEKVIRNSLIIDEGDPYNEILFNQSVNNIKSTNIFQSVKSEIKKSESKKYNKIINLIVEEKPTGEIFAGAGTGTSGSSILAGIKENNYLGRGIKLDTNLYISEDEIKGKFSAINPNFKNSDKEVSLNIESTTQDFMTVSGYEVTRTGFTIGTKFEQYDDTYLSIDFSNYYENLETSSLATAIKKKQEGDYFETLISYGITLNKLNQNFQPSEGYYSSFKQTLPIYSDESTIENTLNLSKYISLSDDIIFSTKFFAKAVNSIDDNVRISKRVYIPGTKLRGFESGKIGPKDATQFVGGNYGTALNFNTTLPNLLYGYENVDFNFFVDAANLWHVDYDSSLDVDKIRSSTGLAINWFTPVGPLSFSYSIPITEAKSDKTESFRFRLGTTF